MSFDSFAIGAIAFGLLVGWCAGMAIDGEQRFSIKKLGALIGVVVGSATVALFGTAMIGWYFLGLAPAFFLNRFLGRADVQRAMAEAIEEARRKPNNRDGG